MIRTDYKKKLRDFYAAKVGTPIIVNVPKMNYIQIDGRGDPNTSKEYQDAIQALYPVAYAIKFICKFTYDKDFGVMPLEGLWWAEDMADFAKTNKTRWQWTVMIMQPDIVTKAIFDQAVGRVKDKKLVSSIDKLKFISYEEGRAAQVLYVGPYADEGPTIKNLHNFIQNQGGSFSTTTKHHHEIYLSDPRRTAPSKLKTIIRQPY